VGWGFSTLLNGFLQPTSTDKEAAFARGCVQCRSEVRLWVMPALGSIRLPPMS
jgi:hypothetical protein